jgi:hypothetical protein
MRKYPWGEQVPFAGHIYEQATQVPRSYAPWWLIIGSPPASIFFAAIGGLIVCVEMIRRKALEPNLLIIGLAFLFPLALIVALHATVYASMRQFLFLVPPLLLFAVYGLVRLFLFFKERQQKSALVALVLLTLFAQFQVLYDLRKIHPYEYMYFSPLIGGIPGADGNYEMDYWGICNKPATEWLVQNYQHYTTTKSPTVMSTLSPEQVTTYLPKNFRMERKSPDFFIALVRFEMEKKFPTYKVIHTEGVQGYVACVVKMKP